MLEAEHRLAICLEAVGNSLIKEAGRLRSRNHVLETREALQLVMTQLRVLSHAGQAIGERNGEKAERLLRAVEASRHAAGVTISPAILDAIEERPV